MPAAASFLAMLDMLCQLMSLSVRHLPLLLLVVTGERRASRLLSARLLSARHSLTGSALTLTLTLALALTG